MIGSNGSLKNCVDALLDMIGVYDGIFAYKGPRCVQIDLTNRCNNDCIGCWCNSPLLEEKKLPASITDETLPTEMVLRLLDVLKKMGTNEIYFAGGGEPFMHPEAMKIFTYAKKKKFIVSINTNFTLVDREKAKRLADYGVDYLIVSVWAGTPAVYALTHPNQSEETFMRIKDSLCFLNTYKKEQKPFIKVYNVLFNMNYHDFDRMLDFISETSSESVEFTVIDTIPGKTDKLLMDAQQAEELYGHALQAKEKYDHQSAPFRLENFHTFLRRISSAFQNEGEYDRTIINEVPCYAGWAFARIIANGDVNSCLKSHRIPIGNLYRDNFKKIWNNARQREFRRKTRTIDVNDPYFRFIGNDPYGKMGCFRSCDNIGHSLLLHEKMKQLTPWQRDVLKNIGSVSRKARAVFSGN